MYDWITRLAWWRCNQTLLRDVFTPGGPANRTYVPRPLPESDLKAALAQPGTQVVIYGESGAGKSSMAVRVLQDQKRPSITTRCTSDMTYADVLTSGFFNSQAFVRTGKKQADEVELLLKSQLGDTRKATASSQVGHKVTNENSYAPVVEAPISAEHLAAVLGRRKLTWIIDDFHKVSAETKESLSHALKVFSDSSTDYPDTQIVVLGAAENAAEVWGSPANMHNRLVTIPLDPLTPDALGKVLDSGAELMNADFSAVRADILRHSVGIVGVTHALAHACCLAAGLDKRSRKLAAITHEDLDTARKQYVRTRSEGIKKDFAQAVRRKASGKYNNCALIIRALATFTDAGATHAELLPVVRGFSDNQYPTGNLTTYLKQLQTEDRASVVRKTPEGYFRFASPLMHTYAAVLFETGQKDHFWREIEASDEEKAAATVAVAIDPNAALEGTSDSAPQHSGNPV
jgi:hypothetical protein